MMIEYDYNKSNINRLLSTIEHREPYRVPYLENWIANKPLYEYVLGRKLVYDPDDLRVGLMPESPEDTVEFAQRLGIDAVICNIDWYPGRTMSDSTTCTCCVVRQRTNRPIWRLH